MSCAICELRKERRFCPALHGRICPQCCGEQREVTLDCPSECIYLQQARKSQTRAAPAETAFADLEIPSYFPYEHEHLITGLAYVAVKNARADREIRDSDVIAALSAAARRYQMLANSGLHYEFQSLALSQQRILDQIEQVVSEYRDTERRHLGYSRLRDTEVLTALVFLLRLSQIYSSGRPKSRGFLDFVSERFRDPNLGVLRSEESPQIILP